MFQKTSTDKIYYRIVFYPSSKKILNGEPSGKAIPNPAGKNSSGKIVTLQSDCGTYFFSCLV